MSILELVEKSEKVVEAPADEKKAKAPKAAKTDAPAAAPAAT